MKNKIFFLIYLLSINFLLISSVTSNEQFNFDVTEVEIKENGNKFFGKKGGTALTEDGVVITANNFEYDKLTNILIASGNVKIEDKIKEFIIYSENITYLKNEEIILTKGKSKAINNGLNIDADIFEYNRSLNTVNAKGNVKVDDKIEEYVIYSEEINYLRNQEEFFSKGKTHAIIQSKYDFNSKNVYLNRKLKKLSSSEQSIITDDNSTIYNLEKFKYLYDKKLLKGENIEVETNHLKKNSDKFYFSNAFINFGNKNFVSKDTKILLHKNIFESERNLKKDEIDNFKSENDPRLSGVSSKGNENKIILDKAIFTSCKKNDNCPPWSIKANRITHDRIKKELIYDNAVLNIYDVPVFYFPKFFHPDPTVARRSGFLQPRLNNSSILGTSLNTPYFHVISPYQDLTFKPTVFDNRIYMFQNEYRQENENSSFIADFNYIKGYKSTLSNNRNSITHLFSKFDLDLNLENFITSKLKIFVEKVNNDTYLKIFDNVLLTDKRFEEDLKDHDNLTSGLKLSLDHDDYNFTAGLTSYENLQSLNNDRYQFVFPYFDFSSTLFSNSEGSLSINLNGRNALSNTNNLRTNITNDLNYKTNDFFSKGGFVNNFGIYFRNLNAVGKNDIKYKSSLQTELLNIYEINTSFPLFKINKNYTNYITPKLSFRINPSDMKDHSSIDRLITTDNIFDINRLGLTDSYESGKSITLGLDYKKENSINTDKYLEIKFGSVIRDAKADKVPKSSSLNRTTSNLFGSIENSFSEFLTLNYDFAIDNNFNSFEHNSLEAEFTVNNFITKFNFLEKDGEMGSANTFENTTSINFDKNNSLLFKTRRNRKISLTEYYDFIYEYQNDCLTAGIKYRKTYYQDRDLRPNEDLFFTITLFPLTTLEQKIDKNLYRDNNNDIIWK